LEHGPDRAALDGSTQPDESSEMTTVNGLPAHIVLVHAIVVLLPLCALVLVVCALWPAARRRLASSNAILSVIVLVLVPITTDAGEWLERRVSQTALLRTHTELGDSALFVAIPVTVLALVIWWRNREIESTGAAVADEQRRSVTDPASRDGGAVKTVIGRPRTLLKPESAAVGIAISVLSVVAGIAAVYLIYRIGDSGAQATWQGHFSTTATSGPGGR
jgi:hypothetical protein